MAKDILHHTLIAHGSSVTKPRRNIFSVLQQADHPLSMSEITSLTTPAIDRSSVYRTIHLFEKLHITQRIYSGWKYRIELTDTFTTHHHHFLCSNCGVLIPFNESSAVSAELSYLEHTYGFHVVSHSLELAGICGRCKKSTTKKL
jgi:Fe2+ or Zn2+ uptake regulation protein